MHEALGRVRDVDEAEAVPRPSQMAVPRLSPVAVQVGAGRNLLIRPLQYVKPLWPRAELVQEPVLPHQGVGIKRNGIQLDLGLGLGFGASMESTTIGIWISVTVWNSRAMARRSSRHVG